MTEKLVARMGYAVALLAIGIAAYGIFHVEMYAPQTPPHMLPGAMSQDIGMVLCGVGLIWAGGRTDVDARWWTVWLGLLGYIGYGYALYAFEGLYNPFYLGYVAAFGLSLWALILWFRMVPLQVGGDGLPRRWTAVLFGMLVVMFAGLWLSIMLPGMIARSEPDGSTIFVFDLAFVLPALAMTAVLLWRREPLGDVLAVPLLIKAASIGVSVLGGVLLAPVFDRSVNWGEAAIYVVLGVLPVPLIVLWLRRMVARCDPTSGLAR